MEKQNPALKILPDHLTKYVVEQKYEDYTALDQAVWRYCMRQLKSYLSVHAHGVYLDGLEKTGIGVDEIPRIDEMSERLAEFGWTAIPVSGFIPPAAFMELQSLSVLPIASDIRTVDHILYTPAPDIVHEAAGHAPIIVDPAYADYLKEYASVAKKAIIGKKDFQQYEAIRVLSDLKEDPNATEEQIQEAENNLSRVNAEMSFVSEAGWLSRMNWWTAEYGLVGEIDDPKIFGAGLLSSVGESKSCLSEKVKKIPLEVDCIEFSYDITEPQPQLFVAQDFKKLIGVLKELAAKMAFTQGGRYGAERAIEAETVNSVELETGLQISGKLVSAKFDELDNVQFIKFEGPTQISFQEKQLSGHGTATHEHGYSSPLGKIMGLEKCVSKMSVQEREDAGFKMGEPVELVYQSGIQIKGRLESWDEVNGIAVLARLTDCSVTWGEQVLFAPEWGVFDLAFAQEISSVFGGPADRSQYDVEKDFAAKRVPEKIYSSEQKELHQLYAKVRQLRAEITAPKDQLENLIESAARFPAEWLLRLELFEISLTHDLKEISQTLKTELQSFGSENPTVRQQIEDGILLANTQ